jgi:hypothetical protein
LCSGSNAGEAKDKGGLFMPVLEDSGIAENQ